MAKSRKTRLDQKLISKIADKSQKAEQYVREQISKRASRLGVSAEAAQILWAKELGIGTATVLRKLEPHIQEQLRSAIPSVISAQTTAKTKGNKSSSNSKTSPSTRVDVMALAIEFLLKDEELRDRCADLLKKKKHSDRVFREATVVLESRITKLAGITNPILPEALVNKAVNPDPNKAILVVSSNPSEQQGFHSICRGIVLAFRNPAHHQIDDKATREDALKFCGFIDVLLDVLGQSTKSGS